MPIIRSSRVLYSWLLPVWYLVLWFSSCRSGVELRVVYRTQPSAPHDGIPPCIAFYGLTCTGGLEDDLCVG
jgi:hypothetical protein